LGKNAIVKNGPKIGIKVLNRNQAKESNKGNFRRRITIIAKIKMMISVARRKMKIACFNYFSRSN